MAGRRRGMIVTGKESAKAHSAIMSDSWKGVGPGIGRAGTRTVISDQNNGSRGLENGKHDGGGKKHLSSASDCNGNKGINKRVAEKRPMTTSYKRDRSLKGKVIPDCNGGAKSLRKTTYNKRGKCLKRKVSDLEGGQNAGNRSVKRRHTVMSDSHVDKSLDGGDKKHLTAVSECDEGDESLKKGAKRSRSTSSYSKRGEGKVLPDLEGGKCPRNGSVKRRRTVMSDGNVDKSLDKGVKTYLIVVSDCNEGNKILKGAKRCRTTTPYNKRGKDLKGKVISNEGCKSVEKHSKNVCKSSRGKGGKNIKKVSASRKYECHSDKQTLSDVYLKSLAKRVGVTKVSKEFLESLRQFYITSLHAVVRNAVIFAELGNRKTVTSMDVICALTVHRDILF